MSKNSPEVSIFHRINKLRLKAGVPLDDEIEGFIDPADIKRAQNQIDEGEKLYEDEISDVLEKLESAWNNLQDGSKDDQDWNNQIYNYSNHIKDLASTYNYGLMAYLGKSLRDICEQIDLQKKEHKVIFDAHLNAMWVCFETNIEEGDEKAAELKSLVEKAINQNM